MLTKADWFELAGYSGPPDPDQIELDTYQMIQDAKPIQKTVVVEPPTVNVNVPPPQKEGIAEQVIAGVIVTLLVGAITAMWNKERIVKTFRKGMK